MTQKDIRWIQRFNNFDKALAQLKEAVELSDQRKLSNLEKQGLIQAFEYTYELAWNTIKDYFEAQGEVNILGSRDTFRMAFKRGLIEDGKTWMAMIESRIATSHTYNEDVVEKIANDTETLYYGEFVKLHKRLDDLKYETLSKDEE